MKKIILLMLSFCLLISCNGQEKKEVTETFDLDSINFTEEINPTLKKIGFNLTNMKKNKFNPPLISNKDIDFEEEAEVWMLIDYSVITFTSPKNIFLKGFSLSGEQLSFDYNDKNQKIGMYIINIKNENKGEKLISLLENKLGIPKKNTLISSQVSHFPSGTNYKKNILQIGYVWKNIEGKTYSMAKYYDSENNTYLGHHLAVTKSDDNYFTEVLSGEWDVISDILVEN
ncbi:hypothetical protein O2K51_13820 [Apibacter raozihei]|uniref:hypothetical protein n=1 Tax=Apibacter TaxID=1778601 RepID=UPI000FE3D149|nr:MULTISPECIES: hypothetical protein [Apibacter]